MLIQEFEKEQIKKLSTYKKDKSFNFEVGDSVKVHYKITEGKTTRIQVFEGIVIAKSRAKTNLNATITVRKISSGIGVERTFHIHSPLVAKIEVTKKGDVRRGKLYFLRNLKGKAARIKEKLNFDNSSSSSEQKTEEIVEENNNVEPEVKDVAVELAEDKSTQE